MVNMLHRHHKRGTRKTAKKFDGVKLQALFDEDDSQTKKQLA